MIEIRTVTAYQIGRRLFKSKYGALRNLAWRKLTAKYAPIITDANTGFTSGGDLAEVEAVRNFECWCGSDGDDWHPSTFTTSGCPLHANYSGYFAKVVHRFARIYSKQ